VQVGQRSEERFYIRHVEKRHIRDCRVEGGHLGAQGREAARSQPFATGNIQDVLARSGSALSGGTVIPVSETKRPGTKAGSPSKGCSKRVQKVIHFSIDIPHQ
jgi:hypothetical protein